MCLGPLVSGHRNDRIADSDGSPKPSPIDGKCNAAKAVYRGNEADSTL